MTYVKDASITVVITLGIVKRVCRENLVHSNKSFVFVSSPTFFRLLSLAAVELSFFFRQDLIAYMRE